jgi:hypothetical protein
MPTLTRDFVDFSTSALTSTCRSYPSRFSITETVYLSIKIALGPAEAKKCSNGCGVCLARRSIPLHRIFSNVRTQNSCCVAHLPLWFTLAGYSS